MLALCKRTLPLVETLADKRQVSLTLKDPPPAAHTICQADEAQIQQVLTNLIVNAIQATPQGGKVQVSISRWPKAESTGWLSRSMTQALVSRRNCASESSNRSLRPKDVGEGTGLGLSIAYGILQEHAGRLNVTDSPLGGARFEVWLRQQKRRDGHLSGYGTLEQLNGRVGTPQVPLSKYPLPATIRPMHNWYSFDALDAM